MSKLVTLQQAKKLKELGVNTSTQTYYKNKRVNRGTYNISKRWNEVNNCYARPSIHEALEWFREVKGVKCAVNLYQDDTIEDCIYYVGCYKDYDVIRRIEMKLTHSEAESALLDALIEYVK